MRLQVFEHYIIEAHPDDTIPDLRLDQPLSTFADYCNAVDWNSLTRDEHLHLPSLIILFKTLQLWQKNNPIELIYHARVLKKMNSRKFLMNYLIIQPTRPTIRIDLLKISKKQNAQFHPVLLAQVFHRQSKNYSKINLAWNYPITRIYSGSFFML